MVTAAAVAIAIARAVGPVVKAATADLVAIGTTADLVGTGTTGPAVKAVTVVPAAIASRVAMTRGPNPRSPRLSSPARTRTDPHV